MSSNESLPQPIFYSIPVEIFEKIIQHVTRKEALALTLTSPRLTASADAAIWRSLDLFLWPTYGILPLVQPAEMGGRKKSDLWAKSKAREAEERHCVALKAKVETVLRKGDERRWRTVKRIWLSARPGAVRGMIQILEACAPTLEELIAHAPAENAYEASWRPGIYEQLDYNLFQRSLHFPSLTHVVLGQSAIQYAALVIRICDSSPNLVSIRVDMRQRQPHRFRSDFILPVISPLDRGVKYKLNEVSFFCSRGETREHVQDVTVIRTLLSRSPRLARLAANFQLEDVDSTADLMTSIMAHKGITDLWLPLHSFAVQRYSPFPAMQRLLLARVTLGDMITYLPNIQSLEVLFYEPERSSLRRSGPTPVHSELQPALPSAASIIPSFAESLWRMPRLKAIHSLPDSFSTRGHHIFTQLRNIERAGVFTGYVRSYRHGEDELLEVRLLIDYQEVLDKPDPEVNVPDPPGYLSVHYAGRSGFRAKILARLPQPKWHIMTDFQGEAVPLEVIEQMRVVEGLEKEDWEKRGVEVGDAAWRVLLDWKERVAAAEYGA